MASVKLLASVIHNGLIHKAGSTLEVDEEKAAELVHLGLAEAESAAKRVVRKATGRTDAAAE